MKIGILGAGSIGCYLGGQLANAGAEVCFVGRPRFKSMLDENGLTLTHYARDPITVPANNFTFDLDATGLAKVDLILMTVKSQDSHAAGTEVAKIAETNTPIVSFQNGVRNVDTLSKAMPGYEVLGAVVPFNVTCTAPGTFHSGTEGDLIIQANGSEWLLELQRLFSLSGQDLQLVDDIAAVQWGKLIINLNNAANTLTGVPIKIGLSQRDYRRVLALMMEEALRVLDHANTNVVQIGRSSPERMVKILRAPDFIYRLLMNIILKIDDSARSSMLDDLEAGRQSEVDYLQGEVVRLGESLGIETPVNKTVLDQVNATFAKGVSPQMTGTELLTMVTNL